MKYCGFMICLFLIATSGVFWINPAVASQVIQNNDRHVPTKSECHMTQEEKLFAKLLINHPDQKHMTLICNPVLHKFAEARAKDLANREYFSHVTPTSPRN